MSSVFKIKPLTREEMEQMEHEIKGDFAYAANGYVYLWDARFGHWAPWNRWK